MPLAVVVAVLILLGSIGSAKYQYNRAEKALNEKRLALQQVEGLESQVYRQKGEIRWLEREKSELTEKVASMKIELDAVKWENANLKQELEETQEQLQAVIGELKQAKTINKELKQVVAENQSIKAELATATEVAEQKFRNKWIRYFKSLPIVYVFGGVGAVCWLFSVIQRRRSI